MKREFLLNIVFLLTANLLIKPFYLFGIDRGVQNTVSEAEYGLYFALFNFTFLFQIVNDFGIQNYNNRQLSQHRQLLVKYFPNFMVLKGLLSVAYLGLVLGIGWLAGYTLPHFGLLLFIAFNQILFSLLIYLRSNITGLGHYRLDSLLSVTDRLLLILICGLLLWSDWAPGPFQIEWFVWAQTASLGLTALLAFGLVARRLPRIRLTVRPAFLLYLLRESAPYALSIFLMSAYYRLDGIMIEQLLAEGQGKPGCMPLLTGCTRRRMWLAFCLRACSCPYFRACSKTGSRCTSSPVSAFSLITMGALTLLAGILFYRTPIMQALYDSGSAYSGRILLYLCLGFVGVAGTYIFGTLLVAGGCTKQLNWAFAIGLLINLGLNIVLIPRLKAEGAAIATFATQAFIIIAELWLSARYLKVSVPPRSWGQLAVAAGLLFGTAYAVYQSDFLAWYWSFFGILAMGGGIALFFVLQNSQLRAYWREDTK